MPSPTALADLQPGFIPITCVNRGDASRDGLGGGLINWNGGSELASTLFLPGSESKSSRGLGSWLPSFLDDCSGSDDAAKHRDDKQEYSELQHFDQGDEPRK